MAYKLSKWDLSPLYPSYESPELQSAFDMIEEQVTSFEGVRNKLAPDMPADQFVDVLKASELTTRIGNKMYSFAGLSFTADTQDQKAQALQAVGSGVQCGAFAIRGLPVALAAGHGAGLAILAQPKFLGTGGRPFFQQCLSDTGPVRL